MQLKILTLLLELKVIIATNHYGYDYLHRDLQRQRERLKLIYISNLNNKLLLILVTGADSD